MAKAKYTHEEMIAKMLENPEIKQEYDGMKNEFFLLKARLNSGKTQEEVAQLMHTTKSAISRLENNSGKSKNSPSVNTLRRYAHALGLELQLKFIKSYTH